ncbi:glycerol-3-phosphate acyltransferase [Candidatus Leptofilum sp.]|uniref:glycerol-3-phosphate acyltransferase n=1 Tax=Candidatus Leptofilum sp. TaxID=3241576 RepID=UPI003B59FD62
MNQLLPTLLWTFFGFLLGSLPFSVWVGKLLLGKDIRQFGDKNPGATNVLRAGGPLPFALALMLDISKGALPLGLAVHIFGVSGWAIVPISLAPPLGHTFSPFLNWRGGKAIAAAFGVWIGITLWMMPVIAVPLLVILTLLIMPSGWALMLALVGMLAALLIWFDDPVLLGVWAGQTLLLAWNHRADLAERPSLRHNKPKEKLR